MYSTAPEHVGLTLDRSVDKKFGSAARGIPASVLYLNGKSREDLYFWLNVITLPLPAATRQAGGHSCFD